MLLSNVALVRRKLPWLLFQPTLEASFSCWRDNYNSCVATLFYFVIVKLLYGTVSVVRQSRNKVWRLTLLFNIINLFFCF